MVQAAFTRVRFCLFSRPWDRLFPSFSHFFESFHQSWSQTHLIVFSLPCRPLRPLPSVLSALERDRRHEGVSSQRGALCLGFSSCLGATRYLITFLANFTALKAVKCTPWPLNSPPLWNSTAARQGALSERPQCEVATPCGDCWFFQTEQSSRFCLLGKWSERKINIFYSSE